MESKIKNKQNRTTLTVTETKSMVPEGADGGVGEKGKENMVNNIVIRLHGDK